MKTRNLEKTDGFYAKLNKGELSLESINKEAKITKNKITTKIAFKNEMESLNCKMLKKCISTTKRFD